jgi:N-acetyl sugar amidotransferase
MMEAAAYGIPILACRVNGIPEIVTPQTGILLAQNTHPDEVARELTRLLTQVDFDREKIRQRCRQYFDAEVNTKHFATELKQMAGLPDNRHEISTYQQCVRCVMDTRSTPLITFDKEGVCHFCRQYTLEEQKYVPAPADARRLLEQTVAKIKQRGKGKRYDCILGISGGVDSTYLAYQAHRLGLRCLLVHFDNGWNSELAVNNINNMVNRLGFDLHTFVVDWEEFKDIQLSFLKASVIDIEMVTDHAILAKMHELALQLKINYILSGTNVVTEAVLPLEWIHNKRDHIHIRAIQKRFGTKPLDTYPLFTSFLKWRVVWRNIQSVSLLNLMPYRKQEVKEVIARELGWRDYGGKHYESVFTRFYQGYILPEKFGVDKRIAHLSNLICSGQITREDALKELKTPPYDPRVRQEDLEFVLKKFSLTREEFQELMQRPVVAHHAYPVEGSIYKRFPPFKVVRPVWKAIKRVFNLPQ